MIPAILCMLFDHPGFIRDRGRWRCVRCLAVQAVN